MAALNELALTLVASVPGVDMQAVAKTILYTVPSGKTCYIFAIIVRNTSASLAGGTEYDFGDDANCTTWLQNVDLSLLTTATTDYKIVTSLTSFAYCAAGAEFGIKPITGSTAAATATLDVIGYLV